MLKIKDNVDLKELEKFGFELEGNTYRKDIGSLKYFGEHTYIAICTIDREIYEPKLPILKNRWQVLFTSSKPYQKLSETIYELEQAGLIDTVKEE